MVWQVVWQESGLMAAYFTGNCVAVCVAVHCSMLQRVLQCVATAGKRANGRLL